MKPRGIPSTITYSDSPTDQFLYARDGSDIEGVCTGVAWPTTKEEISELILYGRKGTPITIRGSGMSKNGGCVPTKSLVLDMSRLTKILDIGHDHVTVEAGIPLAELQRELKKRHLFFPIKPLDHTTCTIGGMIATNTLGLYTAYRRMEDWVLELEVIDGTGRKVKVPPAQRNTVLGKEGTTGVIYAAKLRVLPEPMERTVSIFKFNTITALMDKVLILDKNPAVLSIEFLDEPCSSLVGLGPTYHAIIEYANNLGMIKDPEEIQKIDDLKERLHHLLITKKYTHKEDPKIPLAQTAQFLYWLQKNSIPCFGHLKHRILHPCLRERSLLLPELYHVIKTVKGELGGEYGIGRKRKPFLSADKKAEYQSLKNQFDPYNVLNRGVLID